MTSEVIPVPLSFSRKLESKENRIKF